RLPHPLTPGVDVHVAAVGVVFHGDGEGRGRGEDGHVAHTADRRWRRLPQPTPLRAAPVSVMCPGVSSPCWAARGHGKVRLEGMGEHMTERPPARTHRLELVALGADGWRLCDRSVPVDDATHVIAYVEQVERGFEVVWLNCLHGTSTFAT